MKQLENRMIIEGYVEDDDYDSYLEHLYEEDDSRYEDEIFEKLGGIEND